MSLHMQTQSMKGEQMWHCKNAAVFLLWCRNWTFRHSFDKLHASTANPLFQLTWYKMQGFTHVCNHWPVQTHTVAPELLQIWNPEHEILRSRRHHFPYDIVHRCQQQIILTQVLQTLETTKSECMRPCNTKIVGVSTMLHKTVQNHNKNQAFVYSCAHVLVAIAHVWHFNCNNPSFDKFMGPLLEYIICNHHTL